MTFHMSKLVKTKRRKTLTPPPILVKLFKLQGCGKKGKKSSSLLKTLKTKTLKHHSKHSKLKTYLLLETLETKTQIIPQNPSKPTIIHTSKLLKTYCKLL